MLLEDFKDIDNEMIWKGSALRQIDEFKALGTRLNVLMRVIGSHRSKSISLPVVELVTAHGTFTMRDNFYDTNLLVRLSEPCSLSLEQFFEGIIEPKSWEWYLAEIGKSRGYSWAAWSDEEMNDPRILRVKDKRPGCDLWWDKSSAEKERWAKRLTDPEWYRRDWSSSELTWDGEFGPGVKIYPQYHAFAEGISTGGAPSRYVPGSKDFIITLASIEMAGDVIQRLRGR